MPNAALMVIENADRFGLSQLHQLRGARRAGEASILLHSVRGCRRERRSRERLKVMRETSDGFKISEEDLKLRGPGDFFRVARQHGLPELRVANFAADMQVLARAQSAALEVLKADPLLEKPENKALGARIKQIFELSAEALN